MLQQLDVNIRLRRSPDLNGTDAEMRYMAQKACMRHVGVDQGFHNVLLHGGVLSKYMDVKQFSQGEGPVNTVGGLASRGPHALIKMNLTEWGVLKGKPPNQVFTNWNGDISPAVHQYDQFTEYVTVQVNNIHDDVIA